MLPADRNRSVGIAKVCLGQDGEGEVRLFSVGPWCIFVEVKYVSEGSPWSGGIFRDSPHAVGLLQTGPLQNRVCVSRPCKDSRYRVWHRESVCVGKELRKIKFAFPQVWRDFKLGVLQVRFLQRCTAEAGAIEKANSQRLSKLRIRVSIAPSSAVHRCRIGLAKRHLNRAKPAGSEFISAILSDATTFSMPHSITRVFTRPTYATRFCSGPV